MDPPCIVLQYVVHPQIDSSTFWNTFFKTFKPYEPSAQHGETRRATNNEEEKKKKTETATERMVQPWINFSGNIFVVATTVSSPINLPQMHSQKF